MSNCSFKFNTSPRTVAFQKTKHRLIQTSIPTPGTIEILDKLQRFESRSMHGQLPLIWDKALDYNIFDIAGNKWIDFTSTIFVANVGHSNPHVLTAMQDMLDKPLHSCYAYANSKRSEYLERLLQVVGHPFEKAFLLSAGTEATEAALKLMRMYGQFHGKNRLGIICFDGNWHGRTMGAQMMSGNLSQKEWIGYSDNDIHHIPFPYPWALNGLTPKEFLANGLNQLASSGIDLTHDICGFMLETFQGWGALFYPKDFVQEISTICRSYNILLAFDEMQAGFGRTGKLFGFEHYDVFPDLIACGKGMGGGLPLSGVLGSAHVMDLPEIGNMSSTHSANPLVCAAGLAVLEELINKNLCSEAHRKGIILQNQLLLLKEKYSDCISDVFGKGLIAAVLFSSPDSGKSDSYFTSMIAELCMQKGLLVVHTGRESIKIGPPLTIPDDALIEGVSILDEAIAEALAQ